MKVLNNLWEKEGPMWSFLKMFSLVLLSLGVFVIIIPQIEDISYKDAWWLGVISLSTTGYGDYSTTTTLGRILTVIFLVIPSIVMMGLVAANLVEHFNQKRENVKMGNTTYKSTYNHIVILGVPESNTEEFLTTMKEQIDNSTNLKSKDVIVLSEHFTGTGLPNSLKGWKYVDGSPLKRQFLEFVSSKTADYIFVFNSADTTKDADSATLMTLTNLKLIGTTGQVIAEYRDKENKELLLNSGANNAIRQIRAYPELIVRTADIPGSESIFENLFDFNGQSITVIENKETRTWRDICIDFITDEKNIIPLGFSVCNEVQLNPSSDTVVKENTKIFVMV